MQVLNCVISIISSIEPLVSSETHKKIKILVKQFKKTQENCMKIGKQKKLTENRIESSSQFLMVGTRFKKI